MMTIEVQNANPVRGIQLEAEHVLASISMGSVLSMSWLGQRLAIDCKTLHVVLFKVGVGLASIFSIGRYKPPS